MKYKLITAFIWGLLLLLSSSVPSLAQRDKVSAAPIFVCYEAVRGQPFKNPSGIYYHKKRQEIYVADAGRHEILIFDNKGGQLGKINHMVDGRDGKSLVEGEPRGIAVNNRGDILVTDGLVSYVDVLDYRGRSVQKVYPSDYLGLPKDKVVPAQIALDAEDNLYIATAGEEACVLVLDKTFKLKRKIGKKGTEKGEFDSPSGIWVDHEGKIYVTDALGTAIKTLSKDRQGQNTDEMLVDTLSTSIQIFDKDGKLLNAFGGKGFGPVSFGLPSGCVTDKQGNILILDGTQCKVAAFDKEGNWINVICGSGHGVGSVMYPTYIAGDGVDTFYVAERSTRRIQAFKIRFKEETPANK